MKTPRPKSDAIDWQSVRDRLKRSAEAIEAIDRLSPECVRKVLEQRARDAARVPPAQPEAGAFIEVVRFVLGQERYAIETSCVREILRLQDFTPLPDTPDDLVGITDLRGQILAIFDVRRFFGMTPTSNTEQTRVIVLGQERVEFGLLADAVEEVVLLRHDAIREPLELVADSTRAYLRGVTADALLVLDGPALLRDPRLYIDLDGA